MVDTPLRLKIIRRRTLNPTFSAYHESERGIDDNDRTTAKNHLSMEWPVLCAGPESSMHD